MTNYLFFMHHAFKVEILAFAMLPNQFRLLLRTPFGKLSGALRYFLRETNRAIASETGRINHIYANRFSRSLIESHHYFLNAYKYVLRSSCEAGICRLPMDYKYSTLPALLGKSHTIVPLAEDFTLFNDPVGTVNWLNTPPRPGTYERMERALRRPVMKFYPDRQSGKADSLTEILY